MRLKIAEKYRGLKYEVKYHKPSKTWVAECRISHDLVLYGFGDQSYSAFGELVKEIVDFIG